MQPFAPSRRFDTTRFSKAICALLLTGLFMAGCSYTSERYHPDYHAKRKQIHRLLVLYPEINIVEELADGAMIREMEKSRDAREAAFKAVAQVLGGKRYLVRTADPEAMDNTEVRDVQTLFRSVNRAIQLHTYGPQLYPEKLRNFEYGVGPVDGVLSLFEADALVLIIGHQTLSPRHPKTWISIAVVEPSGNIIWYGMQGDNADLDLQTPAGTSSLVNETLLSFSGFGT
jgi:hypothetical protein